MVAGGGATGGEIVRAWGIAAVASGRGCARRSRARGRIGDACAAPGFRRQPCTAQGVPEGAGHQGLRRPRGTTQRPTRPCVGAIPWLPVLESGRSAPGGLRWTEQHQVGQFGNPSGRSSAIEPACVAAVARRSGRFHVQAQPVARQPQGLDLGRQQWLARRVRPRGRPIQSGSNATRRYVPRAPYSCVDCSVN